MKKLLLLLLVVFAYGRKNVLFLVSDDLRAELGAYDGPDAPSPVHPPMHTPNIDALAKKSLLLKRAYVSQALCSPSRTSLLTSRRPDTTHVYKAGHYFRKVGGNFTTLPQYFKQNGYRTVGMGKIFHPGVSSGHDDPISWTDPYFHATDVYVKDDLLMDAISESREKVHALQDTLIADHAVQTLKEVAADSKTGERPFFVAVGFRKPHTPWIYPAKYKDLYPIESIREPPNYYAPVGMPAIAWHNFSHFDDFKDVQAYHLHGVGNINFTFPNILTRELRQAYYSCISFIDFELGRIIGELESLGLANNTIISFWGDHGWQLGEHAEWAKHTNFEIAAHAPMMIHVPGVTDKGVVTEHLTEFVDLFPTLAEAAGLPTIGMCPEHSDNVTLCTEGTSLVPLMTDPNLDNWKTAAFSQYPRGGDAMKRNNTMGYTMTNTTYRYTEWVKFKGKPLFKPVWNKLKAAELYDHVKDPQENFNLADNPRYSHIRKELSHKLRLGWRSALPTNVYNYNEMSLLPTNAYK